MKSRHPKTWLALFSLAVVLLLVFLDLERTSPGELAYVHADDERLAGNAGCEACHGDAGLAGSCATCHVEVGAQVADGRGFHGNLEDAQRSACGVCHSEHHGAEHELAGERAFVLAGFASRASYDHRGLGLELAGRHAELACVDCHALADAEPLERGERRFLGLDARCASCHDDPHEGRMARNCETCHGERGAFADLTAFQHGRDFPLEGAHAGLACAACHEGTHSVEAVAGFEPPPARACADCHASPHAERFEARVAALLDLPAGASCAECHAVESGGFTSESSRMPRELHAAGGFALDAPHDRVDCAVCHAPGNEYAARYPGRREDDCAACHADPHGGQFRRAPEAAVAAFGAGGCLDCHAPHAFDPPRFGAAEHARTAFPLEASHAEAACRACHLVPDGHSDAPRVFRGTPSDCASCHADPHAGGLVLAEAFDCGECHSPTAFDDVDRAGFDHALWTGFALDGAHALADCESCHARAAEPDELGRRFGRIAALFGEPASACATCHADAHGGRFDAPGLPAVVGGAEGCARCHTTHAFDRVLGERFDHALWTGFELAGAHASATCERCHPRTDAPDALGRRFGRVELAFGAPADACGTCHADPHAGRFDRAGLPATVEGRAGCARCHDERSFRAADERFDHALWTGFALEGAHAGRSCASCHPPSGRAGERELGPAPGADCAACHADPHAGQFREGGRTDCARCHQSAESFDELVFDHGRDARFALDARHAKLDCSACHVPWRLEGGGSAVRYKPLGTECSDCHAPGVGR